VCSMAEVIGTLCMCVCQIRLSHLLRNRRCFCAAAAQKSNAQPPPPARYVAPAPAPPLLLVSAGKSFSADCLFALILRVPEKFFFFSSPASVVVVVVWTKEATVTRSLLRVFVSNARSVRDDDKRGRIGAPRSAQLM
jgi:hypothetical protein